MRKPMIPVEVKTEVEKMVSEFNKTADYAYVPRFKGKFLYLDRQTYFGKPAPICRLEYTGDIAQWHFAIYKYSANAYDPAEWFFPGRDEVDGTIGGAMKAGLQAYPD